MFILIFLFSWGNIVAGDQGGCTPGWVIPGVTVPKGDIIVEYGNPLEILCILHTPTVYNSSLLRFYHDREEVSKELLSIVNETTLRLFVEKPPISSRLYFCKLMTAPNEFKGVCLNYVFVGTKPQAVQNFSCISYNWESLNCSWVPVKNPIRTEYHIVFTFTERKRNVYKCPDKSDIEDNFCHWSSETKPSYRSPYENYFFTLTGENKFGSLVRNYTINHFAVVVPRRPENLSCVNLTSSSLTISWVIPSHLRLFPPGIKDKVIYQSKWDPPNYWKEVNTSFVIKESERRVLNITGLKYANTIYDIRVLLKSEIAEDEEKWWSEPATITFRTKPAVPGMSPKTDVGSFECKAQETFRNIYIYWQQIPQYEENGEDLEYKILRIKELIGSKWIERNVWPSAVTKTYAFFTMMSFNRYNFTIAASNKEGISRETSHVVVPSIHQSPEKPVFLKKIAYQHGVYELSWNAPPHSYNITSYTIFWCDDKINRSCQCNGFLDWTRVSSDITKKNITLPPNKIFQFAISANHYNLSSSGMHWVDCPVLPDQDGSTAAEDHECGTRYNFNNIETAISHGRKTVRSEFPWHVALYRHESAEKSGEYICGGSILHPKVILTAAHCVYDETFFKLDTATFTVVAGKYNVSWENRDPDEQRFKVVHIKYPSTYVGYKNRYADDIALLELNTTILFNSAIMSVCIDWKVKHPLEQLPPVGTVVGWGLTEKNITSNDLQMANLKFIEFETCSTTVSLGYSLFISSDKFCAGLENGTAVQCGDSGGGITFPRKMTNNKVQYYMYGIVSVKDIHGSIAAFTDVRKHLHWLKMSLKSIIES